MLLEIWNLVAEYGSFQALREVSLGVDEKEVVTILGANGAGKTTLVKVVVGLVKSKKGRIQFMGDRIDQLSSSQIIPRGIAISPQGGGCFPDMSVMKNLLMGLITSKEKAEVNHLFRGVTDLFPVLEERKNQKAGSLSGGERQMLAIGRALMGSPRLLILDEPSLGLAPLVINSIFGTIERLKGQGLTILLVEQNASKSLKIADRGYVMELGRISIAGTSAELQQDERVKNAYMGL
jgi:branched-chain amino acid transport system ATP-binding protein